MKYPCCNVRTCARTTANLYRTMAMLAMEQHLVIKYRQKFTRFISKVNVYFDNKNHPNFLNLIYRKIEANLSAQLFAYNRVQ